MAQMPLQFMAGRAQLAALVAARPPAVAPVVRGGVQGLDSEAISGAISGSVPGSAPGLALRPGSIDQTTFRARMEALNRADPGLGAVAVRPPVVKPAAKLVPDVPTLTPAQLAALGFEVAPSAAPQTPVPTPTPETALPPTTDPLAVAAPAPASEAAPETVAAASTGEAQSDDAAPRDPMPIGPMPGARLGRDGAWELPRQPGKDERAWLQGMNAKWRVVENPESVRLFLGEDGKFGFDDFLDIINPLQHIPLVNLAYRALTGDTVDGAAQLLGALPFGPMAMVSTVTDLAFRSQTGAGMAENGLALLFGPSEAQPDAIATASGATQVADAAFIRRGSNR